MGTDSRNVLARAIKGYAKKGSARFLNQETAKWIDKKMFLVESFYIRGGHNFSADGMSRTYLGGIIEWPRRVDAVGCGSGKYGMNC